MSETAGKSYHVPLADNLTEVGEDRCKWLWHELSQGNDQALYQLYKICYDTLYRYGLSVSFEKELVKDCINKVFADLWEKHAKLLPVESVKGYIFICFKRLIFHELKRKGVHHKKHNLLSQEAEEISVESYEQIIIRSEIDNELREKLQLIFSRLSPRQKELLLLRYYEDLSFEEIAERTSVSIRTVYNTVYEALNRLRTEFGGDTLLMILLLEKIF